MSEMVTFKQKEKAIFVSLMIGVISIVPTIVAAIFSNSLIILTDVFQNGSEIVAVFFSYVAIRKVSKGSDLRYNYGYGKLEGFSSLVMAAILGISILVILFNAYQGIIHPEALTGVGVILAVVANAAGIGINGWQWNRYRRIFRESPSPIIEGQLKLYRGNVVNDVSVTASLCFGLIFRQYAWASFIDPAGAIILSGFLFYSAYSLFSSSMDNLMDRTLEESLQTGILGILAKHFDAYAMLHDIRSRRSGMFIFIDLYLEFDPEKSMGEVTRDICAIRTDIESIIRNCQVNIVPCTDRPRVR